MMREWVTRPVSRAGILCCLVASAVAAAAATATVSNFIPCAAQFAPTNSVSRIEQQHANAAENERDSE
jgi:hypothetical protein